MKIPLHLRRHCGGMTEVETPRKWYRARDGESNKIAFICNFFLPPRSHDIFVSNCSISEPTGDSAFLCSARWRRPIGVPRLEGAVEARR